jgi:hypothetical protein
MSYPCHCLLLSLTVFGGFPGPHLVPLLFLFFRYLYADDAVQCAWGCFLLTPTNTTNSTNSWCFTTIFLLRRVGGGEELVQVQVTSLLTSFSNNGEYPSQTL